MSAPKHPCVNCGDETQYTGASLFRILIHKPPHDGEHPCQQAVRDPES